MSSKADRARRNPKQSVLREQSFLFRGKSLFAASVLIGSASIFASEPFNAPMLLGVVLPITVMGIYLFIGLNGFVDTIDTETFADSVYYLGFLLTLISLSAALFYLRNEDPSLNLLVAKFGLALITTIVGLAVRVAMVNFQIKGAQARQYAEERLSSAVERFANDLELTCDKMEVLLQGTIEKVEATSNSVRSASEQAHAAIIQSSDSNRAQLNEMYDAMGSQWTKTVEEVSSTMEKELSSSVAVAAEQIKGIGSKLEEEIGNFRLEDDVLSKALDKPLNELAHTIRTARVLLAKEYNLLKESSKDHSEIQEQFTYLSEALESGRQTVTILHQHSEKLSKAFEALGSLDTGLVALGQHAESTSQSLETMNTTVSSSAVSFSEDVATSKESFMKLNQSLNALLHAVMKQSEEMGRLVQRISEDAEAGRSSLRLVQDNLIESSEVIVKHLK
jgi:hypothetical protein